MIGYYPFVPRFVKAGWSFLDFAEWMVMHPLVRVGPLAEMRSYWDRWGRATLYTGQIQLLDPDLPIPHRYHTPPLYPGRFEEYTYTVRYQLFDPEIGEFKEAFVTTLSESVMTPGEVLEWAEERVSTSLGPSGGISRDFKLQTAEWRERA